MGLYNEYDIQHVNVIETYLNTCMHIYIYIVLHEDARKLYKTINTEHLAAMWVV